MVQIKTILQQNLFPLGVTGDVIEKIETEIIRQSDEVNKPQLRDFTIEYKDHDGEIKSIPCRAVNDVAAWRNFKAEHPGLEPSKILDVD